MSGAGVLVKGWCPSALRPMASGDGLLVRTRVIGGVLTPGLCRLLAHCAATFGNGHVDLTARGNLQIRGVTEARLPSLQAALAEVGLIEEDPAVDSIRNIISSPLAGCDPNAAFDIRPSLRALDERLRTDFSLRTLPGKFGFAIDDGGCMPLRPDITDVVFVADRKADRPGFVIVIGGEHCGWRPVDDLADAAARLANAFQALRGEGARAPRRMRALIQMIGAPAIARAAGLSDSRESPQAPARFSARVLGFHALGSCEALGVGAPFGRLDATRLEILSDEAEAACGEIRLTPWRAVFILGERLDPALPERMGRAGFLLDDDAPLRAVAACPGAPSCANGSTATHTDAMSLAAHARLLRASGLTLHVSGCVKGCAHPRAAPVTLVGRAGAYDLVIEGSAADQPVISGVSAPQAQLLLTRLAALSCEERRLAAPRFYSEIRG